MKFLLKRQNFSVGVKNFDLPTFTNSHSGENSGLIHEIVEVLLIWKKQENGGNYFTLQILIIIIL